MNIVRIILTSFAKVIGTLIKLLISQLIGLVVIPIALGIYLVNHIIIRQCLRLYLNVRFGGKLRLVSDSGDAMFGYKSSGNNRNILIALECKKIAEVENKLEHATKLMSTSMGNKRPYEKLKWIFTKHLGYFCWKYDDSFSLENHLLAVPEPMDHEELERLMQELRVDMPEEHPQWQFLFIPNYRNKEGAELSSIILRFHHGILDGLSFVTFVSHCLGFLAPESDEELLLEGLEASPETFPYILNPLKFAIPFKYRLIYNINCLLFGFWHLLRTLLSTKSHWKMEGGKSYPGESKSYLTSERIETETLNVIREECRVSVPSILACAFLQALEKSVGGRLPPKEVQVGHSLAILPYPDPYFHNRFTLMTVPYHRDGMSLTRMEKVKEYHRSSMEAMRGPEYSLYYWFFQFYGKLPAALFKFPLKKPRFSFLINNLPFSKKQVIVWNHRVLDVVGWPPYTTDAGIGITCVGYCDTIRVGATADSSWMTREELNTALAGMVAEIKLLAKECSSSRV